MERGSRTKLVTATVLVAVFGSGILLGFAADGDGAPASGDPVEESEGVTAERDDSGESRERRRPVYEQMEPSAAQLVRIDSIMGAHRARMGELNRDFRAARDAYRESYDALIQDTREAIAEVFPPDVAAEYRELLADFDRRRDQERSERDGRR